MNKPATPRRWTANSNEDGEPWGVYIDGHIDLTDLKSPEAIAEMRHELLMTCGSSEEEIDALLKDAEPSHLWMRDRDGDDDVDPDFSLYWCSPDAPGAWAVSGIKF